MYMNLLDGCKTTVWMTTHIRLFTRDITRGTSSNILTNSCILVIFLELTQKIDIIFSLKIFRNNKINFIMTKLVERTV